MSDLISREVLYREIARLEELARGRVLDTPSSSPCYDRYAAQLSERTNLKHLVADAPTAYDADKVVEQLEKLKENHCPPERFKPINCEEIELNCDECFVNAGIEIVKGGGVDEN